MKIEKIYSAPMAGVSDYPFRQMIRLFGNQTLFSDDLRRPATSMKLELEKEIDIEELKIELFGQLADNLHKMYSDKYLSYFREHNFLQNKRVRVVVNNQIFIGEVVGLDDDFCLKIVCRDMVLHIDSGEIEIL